MEYSLMKYLPPVTGHPWLLYWRVVIRPRFRQIALIVGLMTATAAFEVMTVALTVPLMDAMTGIEGLQETRGYQAVRWLFVTVGVTLTPARMVFVLLTLVCGVFILRSIFLMAHQYWTTLMAYQMRRETRLQLFERYIRARYEELTKEARGAVIHHINTPSDAVFPAILNLGSFVSGLLSCIVMIAVLMYFSWWLTLGIGTIAILGVQGWRRYADSRGEACGRALYTIRGQERAYETDALDGAKLVKTGGLEARVIEQQRELLKAEARPTMQLVLYKQLPHVVNEIIAISIVLALGSVAVFVPSSGIRFSMLVAFLIAIRRIAAALASVNTASTQLSSYTRALQTIEDVLGTLPQERCEGREVPAPQTIIFSEVTFRYPSRPHAMVLQGLNLQMRRGTITAIVGSTGAGKSTVGSLLLGLYEPEAGSVRIDGVLLRDLALRPWRRRIGYVSQDIFVFNSSIRENIVLGDQISPETLDWAVETAQLRDFINELPEGLDTMVGDRGLRLSGGQCQRLTIARAIVHRPAVLIFDEATSALDNLTERAVYDATKTLRHEAIVMVIAHRLSTIRDADQIIVLDRGRAVAVGTHEQLMRQQSLYARLYEESVASTSEAPATESSASVLASE